MAFTKITNAGFGLTTGTLVGVAASFSSTVSVGGTLTYEDVTNVDSVGLITARNGIEVTDKGVQVGTGATVDSAAANTLTFLTGGSERVRIDSSGFIGIGVTNPSSYLAGSKNLVIGAGSGAAGLTVRSSTSTDGFFAFADGTTGNETYRGYIAYGHSTDSLRFATSATERVRIDSSGNIGIDGTTAPRAKFDFGSGTGNGTLDQTISNYQAVFESPQGTGNYSRNIGFAVGTNGIGAAINAVDNGGNDATGLIFATGTAGSIAERLRIDSSGRLLLGTTTEGYSSGDDLTIATSGHTGITLRSGTTSEGAVYFSDATSGGGEYIGSLVYSHNTNSMVFTANGAERMRIDSSGRVGINNSSPSQALHITTSGAGQIRIADGSRAAALGSTGSICFVGSVTSGQGFAFYSANSEQMRLDSSGNFGLNTTSPNFTLDVNGEVAITEGQALSWHDGSGGRSAQIYGGSGDVLVFRNTSSNTERMRIDSAGRLLVGTNTSRTMGGHAAALQVSGTDFSTSTINITNNANSGNGAYLFFSRQRSGSVGGNTALTNNDMVGQIRWLGADGTDINSSLGTIDMFVDGTPGSNDMPGRMVFSTTADGASSPTERMRITAAGNVLFGKTSVSTTTPGFEYRDNSGDEHICMTNNRSAGGEAAIFNRQASDGNLINFVQAGTVEGSISVSGTTVSYNGGHLSRWSQLEGGAGRAEILRGTVLSNLDEMCDWGEEDNEQLNRMKISDVEGDPNVAGVFMCWDEDETYANDFYCSMTGDFIIRIAQGTTVARGDLLMSAGDGTAKPQDDDIVRSKTIAKVTSTTVSATYSDGSYCVPCVLMAC